MIINHKGTRMVKDGEDKKEPGLKLELEFGRYFLLLAYKTTMSIHVFLKSFSAVQIQRSSVMTF